MLNFSDPLHPARKIRIATDALECIHDMAVAVLPSLWRGVAVVVPLA